MEISCTSSIDSVHSFLREHGRQERACPRAQVAYGPAVPQDKGYLVEEIRGGLYWVTEGAYQVMFLTTGEGVIVVDTPPSIAGKMLLAVAGCSR